MNLIEKLQQSFNTFLLNKFNLNPEDIKTCEFTLNVDETKSDFGDINSNAAMILGKQLKKNPREIAKTIVDNFADKNIKKIEVAGPGFINIFLTNDAYIELLKELVNQKDNFFKPSDIKNKTYSIEFVSANPTGPLHLGHGRGGIIGDVLGNILKFLGYKVIKEFYINDAGRQIKKLGESFKIRCQQELGINIDLPEDSYQGEYLIELAKKCINEHGKDIVNNPDAFFEEYAKEHLLEALKNTLSDYGISYDVWFSEKTLHESSQVAKAIEDLKKIGFTYEKDNALWFKSTEFGDDKDRVLKKADGELTYVAADIAYMKNKVQRGADHMVMILGQDHHSYVVRLHGLQKATGLQEYPLDIILYQLVKMKEGGKMLRMSKRAGRIVTLRDVIDTVGKDVARFFYLNRKADAQLEFDLDLALTQTEENPVYYIQYAFVRTRSILEKAQDYKELQSINIDDANNINHEEYELIKKIVSLKTLLETISKNYQTHLLTYYVLELATVFHRYYSKNRVIDLENVATSRARLLLIQTLRNTLNLCLDLLGISAPEKM